jgi:serralysin
LAAVGRKDLTDGPFGRTLFLISTRPFFHPFAQEQAMPSFELIASTTSTQTLDAGQNGTIGIGVTLSGSISLIGDGARIQNAGSILAGGSVGIYGSNASGLDLINSGVIQGGTGGVAFGSSDTTLDANFIINTGQILSTSGSAMTLNGSANTIFNDGNIIGGNYAIRLDDEATGTGHKNLLRNTGLIAASVEGYYAYDAEGYDDTIINLGTIIGTISPGAGLANFQNGGLLQGNYSGGDGHDTITNDGIIRGSIYVGAGGANITNDGEVTGTIGGGVGNDYVTQRGEVYAISLDAGNDRVWNTGVIVDRIFAGEGNDTIDNSQGTVLGSVELEEGDDRYMGSNDGGTVRGDEGDDTISGGNGADNLYAGTGDDWADGGAGNDDLRMDSGNDQASGGSGNDYILLEDGDDLGDGGLGNDYIFGGEGRDSLYGGYSTSGVDTLLGGGGRDQLYGGLGADEFLYVAAFDSVGSESDRIFDFKHGQDKINLAPVFAGTLKFMGKAGFADNGIESVRYKVVGKTAQVLVDADGDGVADMKILLSNVKLLTAGDFIL